MARFAVAASVLLSLFLLSTAHRFPSSDLPIEAELVPTISSSDAAAIRLPSEKPSEESFPKTEEVATVDGLFPTDKPSEESIPTTEEVTTEKLLPTADARFRAVPIEVSLIPVHRDLPFPRPGRPFWRRLGRHCHHMHRGPHGGFPRGAVIPYGDNMIVPAEQVRRGYEGGRYFSREAREAREAHAGRFHHPMMMEEISVEDLGKQREMGVPREMRPFPRFRPHGHHDEEERGLVKRFLDLLNRH